MPKPPARCGTYSGYQRHRRRGEPICGDCRVAYREYSQDYARRNRRPSTASGLPRKNAARCGTYSGDSAHRRRGEEPCEPCRLARNQADRDWRHRTGRNAPHRAATHGTSRARRLHRLAGEPLCLVCAWSLAPAIAKVIADPECGTPKAIKRHRERGETCPTCHVTGVKGRPITEPHGTTAALRRHEYHHEKPCDPCREVQRRVQRERRERARARRAQDMAEPA